MLKIIQVLLKALKQGNKMFQKPVETKLYIHQFTRKYRHVNKKGEKPYRPTKAFELLVQKIIITEKSKIDLQ